MPNLFFKTTQHRNCAVLSRTILCAAALLSFQLSAQTADTEPKSMNVTTSTPRTTQATTAKPTVYNYETVANDPLGTKIYTLANGLKVYLSVNKNEPRIFTNIAVRAGSKQDPAETTGLAHYLEHMMFKGTSQIASLDWEKEKVALQNISDLYEQHKAETDPAKRKKIYAQIDSASQVAAKFVAANEYDKMISSIGAKATNAYTNNESTVYVNDIPSNELEKWMQVEGERFKMVVLRLFHTELEAVYEEFNIGQDNDGRKVYYGLLENMFPTHPYGTQTTIGKAEHLKSPSHVNIHQFFDQYYVPNNMAIVLAGDLDPDATIALIEKYFGSYTRKNVAPWQPAPQPEIKGPIKKEVFGQQAAYLQMAWRIAGANSTDADIITMLDNILSNGKAGLIDLDLSQQQKVLNGGSSPSFLAEYSFLGMNGTPREGQTLEEVQTLLLAELDKVKKGDFPDWLIEASIRDLKLRDARANENNNARVSFMTDAFIKGITWDYRTARIERLKKITKQQIVDFANKNLRDDNYVVVFKRTGDDKNVVKVEKPKITPNVLNRKDRSAFSQQFFKANSPSLSPVFVDFKEAIAKGELKHKVPLSYIKNTTNELFSLYYIVKMGKAADKKLPFAMSYLPFLGTDKYTAAQLQQEFYKLGVSFDVFSDDQTAYVTLSGLDESFAEGVKLFEHILKNVQPDVKSLKNLVADNLKERDNAKKDKRTILRAAMSSYAKGGKNSSFLDILSKTELENLTPEELIARVKDLTNFEHEVFYYGTRSQKDVVKTLDKLHETPKTLKPVLPTKEYDELETPTDRVMFVDFPMVQAEVLMISKGTPQYSIEENIMASLYNNYFGAGLSSIVFQEIRESKALAYSANAFYTTPSRLNRAHYYQAYVGTQVDKLKDAVPAMREIIENMPVSDAQIEQARQSVLKQIESERITKTGLYFSYRNNLDKGIERDLRKDVYDRMKMSDVAALKAFQAKFVKGRKFTYLVLGDKKKVDMNFLKTIGTVEELTLEQIFGY
jgi:predicted Zn-dependent peptidase